MSIGIRNSLRGLLHCHCRAMIDCSNSAKPCWFSATPKTRLYLRPRFFSFPFHARAMNSGLILHVIHCQSIWQRVLQSETQTERERVTTDLAVSRSRPIVPAVGKCLHHLEINLTEGPQENGTVLPKTKTRTKTTSEHLRKSRRIQERGQFFAPHNISLPRYHVTDCVAASKQLERTPRLSSDTFRKSPRLQQKQAANQQRTKREGQSRPLQKPAVKQSNRRKKKT